MATSRVPIRPTGPGQLCPFSREPAFAVCTLLSGHKCPTCQAYQGEGLVVDAPIVLLSPPDTCALQARAMALQRTQWENSPRTSHSSGCAACRWWARPENSLSDGLCWVLGCAQPRLAFLIHLLDTKNSCCNLALTASLRQNPRT